MDMGLVGTALGVLAVPLLVLLNAFFVAAEFSLVAVRRTRVDEMINQRRAGATAVKHAIENLDDAIAATQLGITLASLALGWVGEPLVARLLLPLFAFLPAAGTWIAAHTVATVVAFTLITFLHVILGELVPKAVALQRPDRVSLWMTQPLLWFSAVMRPFIAVMNAIGNGVLRLLGFEPLERASDGAFGGRVGAVDRRDASRRRPASRSGRVRAQRVSLAGQARARLPGAARADGRARAAHARGADSGSRSRWGPHAHAGLRGERRQHRGHRQHQGSVPPVQLAGHGRAGRRHVSGRFSSIPTGRFPKSCVNSAASGGRWPWSAIGRERRWV